MNTLPTVEEERDLKFLAATISKHFTRLVKSGMHPDEFWYWLVKKVDPRPTVRPRTVRHATEEKRRRADAARKARQSKNFERNERIIAHYETSLEIGEPLAKIYRDLSKRFNLKQRQLRNILGNAGARSR